VISFNCIVFYNIIIQFFKTVFKFNFISVQRMECDVLQQVKVYLSLRFNINLVFIN
jgi:hypothetical protein